MENCVLKSLRKVVFMITILVVLVGVDISSVRAEVVFGDKAKHVMCNIIYAVETGGQVYGNADYGNVTEAYTNSNKEHAITIGAGGFYGTNAKKVLDKVRTDNPDVFKKLDTSGIGNDLDTKDWSRYKISKSSAKAKCISAIISSEAGVKAQDNVMFELFIKKNLEKANELGINDPKLAALFIETCHLNPTSTYNRYKELPESSKNYEGYYQWLLSGTSRNTVHGTIYRSRHVAVKKMVDAHAEELNDRSSSSSSSSSSRSEGSVRVGTVLVDEWGLVGMPSRSLLGEKYSLISLPSYEELSSNEMYTVSEIRNDILTNESFELFDTIRVSVVFLGLVLVFYSVLLLVAYMFDRVNNLFEINLLSLISFGLLRYSDEEEYMNKKGVMGRNRIIKVSALCLVVGLFIVSGGVFSWALRFIYAVSGVL